MFDVFIFFIRMIALFGPLLFVRPYVSVLSDTLSTSAKWRKIITKLQGLHIGSFHFGRWLFGQGSARILLGLLVMIFMLLLNEYLPLVTVLFIGPAITIVLLANMLDLDDELPESLHLPHIDSKKVISFFIAVLLFFIFILGVEVLVKGPDLRPDGLHGWIAPKILGFHAQPVMLYDVEGKHEPLGALFLGGTSDLYVLYDPCNETVRLVPVSLSRVEVIKVVSCNSP